MEHVSFDAVVDRKNTLARKWDARQEVFGCEDLLPMWIADMDFLSPPAVAAAIQKRAAHGMYGYASRPASYFETIVNWLSKRHHWAVETAWICPTPAVVTAISIAVQAFTRPGDRVMIQTPVYPPFFACVLNNSRTVAENPLRMANGRFCMDFDHMERQMAGGVAMFILCSPHNPVGRVWTKEELTRLAELCCRYNVLIITDEIHSDLAFPECRHIPLASLNPEIARRTITCISPSKSFNLAGFYTSSTIIADAGLRERFRQALEALEITGSNLFGIVASEAAYGDSGLWLDNLLVYLEENANYLHRFLTERIPAIQMAKPEGTYLAWLDCRQLGLTGMELKRFFTQQAKVGLNDGATFGKAGQGFMRLNYGCPRAVLTEGLERIDRAVRQYKGGR
ncbi:aminotransferase class i/classii [Lucifera butyrica]|uniref:cysteine-S-conjugate beta-lyase n=1 Tax=Lucifera butyrica TaxID=1351585 RepID=A0A498R1R7_9FIRM|nr:PatB family C-S lyase [Lucifera butyrica]VBB05404.1 aminotransferase class i/classii [Lucifera butyrica]